MSQYPLEVVNNMRMQRVELISILDSSAKDLEQILHDPSFQRKSPNLAMCIASLCMVDICLWHVELKDSGRSLPSLDFVLETGGHDNDAMMRRMTGLNKEEWDKLSDAKHWCILKEYMLLGLMNLKSVFDDIINKGYATTLEMEMILPAVLYTLGQITVYREEREATN